MKVLLVGSYHGNNKGDETILFAFLERIRHISKDIEVTITTNNEKYFREVYTVKTVKPLNAFFKLSSFDVVILGGGGLLFDYSLRDTFAITKKSQLLYWLIISYCAKVINKKVLWIAIGVGPLTTRFANFCTKFVARRVDYITVRDKKSFDIVQKMGVKNLLETRDIVFGIKSESEKVSNVLLQKDSILIIPRYWGEPIEDLIYTKFSDLIEAYLNKGDAVILSETNHMKDYVLNKKLSEKFKDRDNFTYFPIAANTSLDIFFDLLRSSKLLISMRMHPIIIASLFGIPSIAIEYNTPKITELMKNLGLESLLFSLQDKFEEHVLETGAQSLDFFTIPMVQNLEGVKTIEKTNTDVLKQYLNYV